LRKRDNGSSVVSFQFELRAKSFKLLLTTDD
jgi:hypothetical protein